MRTALLLIAFTFLSESMRAYTIPYPESMINGIRYFEFSQLVKAGEYSPSLPDFRILGFALNLDDEGTYIAPDGKIVPRFDDAVWVVAPDEPNDYYNPPPSGSPSSYTGEIYLPDVIEKFSPGSEEYVLGFDSSAMAEGLTALRTPLYMLVEQRRFKNAVDLQKIQFGSCHSVESEAFNNCAKLETVIFERAPYVYKKAFKGCPGIKVIVLLSDSELPSLENVSAFEDCVYDSATVYVPDTLIDAFKNDPIWSNFVHVKSLKESKVELVKP